MCIGSSQTPAVGAVATQSIGSGIGAASLGSGSGGGAMSGAGGASLSRPASRGTVLTGEGGAGPATGRTERAPRNVGVIQRKNGGLLL